MINCTVHSFIVVLNHSLYGRAFATMRTARRQYTAGNALLIDYAPAPPAATDANQRIDSSI